MSQNSEIVQPWTHWKNEKQHRLFLVVDVPTVNFPGVVLMEVKYYKPEEERKFIKLTEEQWVEQTETTKALLPHIPKV